MGSSKKECFLSWLALMGVIVSHTERNMVSLALF
jgi:hypothetical protein